MYESPIWITSQVIIKDITKDTAEDVNNGFVQAIQKAVNFHVDKREIEKALKYDRDQYDKGYADALKDLKITSQTGLFYSPKTLEKITPKEFYEKMKALSDSTVSDEYIDLEDQHIEMDELMCEVLTQLGYGDGVEAFKNAYKWYA